ncbi:MAG: hypothetical protein HON90_14490 [Halobacteriovoraceae bacterium]|jgi:hypothetical protein|nr:hypothetical protein [Halobacteriovoraceae bacterium]
MKKMMTLIAVLVTSSAMAERIVILNNDQAREVVMNQKFVQDQFDMVEKLSTKTAQLIHITSKEVGIREDRGLDERYNSGMKHKFMFENSDSSLACNFSIYVIYQDTVPLSINKTYSKVTSETRCTKY